MNLCDWKRTAAKGRESSLAGLCGTGQGLCSGSQDKMAFKMHVPLWGPRDVTIVINVPFSRQGSVAGLQWMSLSSAQNICPIWQFLRTEVLCVCGVVVMGGGGDIVSCVEIIKPITGPSKF